MQLTFPRLADDITIHKNAAKEQWCIQTHLTPTIFEKDRDTWKFYNFILSFLILNWPQSDFSFCEFYIFSDALGASSPESLYSPSTELLAFVFGVRPAKFWNAPLGGIVEFFSNFVLLSYPVDFCPHVKKLNQTEHHANDKMTFKRDPWSTGGQAIWSLYIRSPYGVIITKHTKLEKISTFEKMTPKGDPWTPKC